MEHLLDHHITILLYYLLRCPNQTRNLQEIQNGILNINLNGVICICTHTKNNHTQRDSLFKVYNRKIKIFSIRMTGYLIFRRCNFHISLVNEGFNKGIIKVYIFHLGRERGNVFMTATATSLLPEQFPLATFLIDWLLSRHL